MAKANKLPDVGDEITYLGVDYLVMSVTDTGVELRRRNPHAWEGSLVVNIGSPRYAKIFGGDIIKLDSSIPDTVLQIPQTKSMLSAYVERRNSIKATVFIFYPVPVVVTIK